MDGPAIEAAGPAKVPTFTILAERAMDGDSEAAGELLRDSAGSVDALRALYEAGIMSYNTPDDIALGAAKFEVIARLIAAKTGGHRDRRCVAACLTIQALEHHRCEQIPPADDAATEALSILRQLVDEGDGEALIGLANFPDQFAHLRSAQEAQKASAIVPDALAQARADLDQERARSEGLAAALMAPPLTGWERVKLWGEDRAWRVRFVGWAIADLGRALVDIFKK